VRERAMEPVKIREDILNMKHSIKDMVLTYNTEEALNRALSIACPEDLVLITGSLFIVGEVKEYYQKCVNIA